MKVIAKQNRELLLINAQNTQNENKAETIELIVPQEYEDYNKKIVFITDDDIVWDVIQDNTYTIKKAITKYKQVDFYIWLTKDDVDFRTKTKTLIFYDNKDASDEITEEEISGVNTIVNILEDEITKVEGLEEDITSLITDIQKKLDDGEFDGKDGYSPIITETQTANGYDITITDAKGTKTISLVNGKDGEKGDTGEKGKDGYTPVKGIDYFTQADKKEIEEDVIEDITPTLNRNLQTAKDYTDNQIIKDIKDITYNSTTGVFIFTRHDNTTITVDLPIEQNVKSGYYDNNTQELVLVLMNDQEIRIPASGLVDIYTGETSATIQVVISADNKITCNIKSGSISKTLLTTELQQEINSKVNTDTFNTELAKKLSNSLIEEKDLLVTYEDTTTETLKLVVYK